MLRIPIALRKLSACNASSLATSLKLNNGKEMPQFGLGTWLSETNSVQLAVEHAINIGYRHIDCAWIYENEAEVGRAISNKIEDGTVTRDDLFITSKLWNIFHDPTDVSAACEESLHNLGLSHLDLYLMHNPTGWQNIDGNPFPLENRTFLASPVDYVDTWHALEALVKENKTHSIGVSNFNSYQIDRIVKEAKSVLPVTNQIEVNPYVTNVDVIKTCHKHNITITAYSPLGNPSKPETRSWKGVEKMLIDEEIVAKIALKYGKSPAQILLRYSLDRDLIVIPKSVTPSRIESNAEVFDFKLTNVEISLLNGLNSEFRVVAMGGNHGHKYYPFKANYSE